MVRTSAAELSGANLKRLIIAILAAAVFVVGGAWWAAGRVESDLARRSRAALAAAGIAAQVYYDGSDAVLTGRVVDAGQAADAIGIVAVVPGTRHVTSRLTLASTSDLGLPAAPDSAPSGAWTPDGGSTPATPGLTDASTTSTPRPRLPMMSGTATDSARLPRGSITFASDDAVLSPDAAAYLDRVVAVLTRYPEMRLVVRGHSDDLGPDEANWAVSKQRAQSVIEYLVSRQVAADRLKLEVYAGTSPVVPNDSLQGQAANRRVELVIEEVS